MSGVQQAHNESSCDDQYIEPLGYQHFLYDVNVEYNPGGNRAHSNCNTHSFRLKYIPYMVHGKNGGNNKWSNTCKEELSEARESSITSSNNSSECQLSSQTSNNPQIDDDSSQIESDLDTRFVDVTKETCAFLGNSDYVPNCKTKQRQVLLELISAKLSQTTVFNLTNNLSHTSLVTLAEQPPSSDISFNNNEAQNSFNNCNTSSNTPPSGIVQPSINNSTLSSSPQPPPPPPPQISSKRFVNYTILIKTITGLDKHPAVIERRFSDFLQLYQGLKSHTPFASIIDKNVSFPKKVYMGNFSLTNIAERSIEFSRLLSVCMYNPEIMWSVPFISFLLDKELIEAHKLSLFGDPDDVQALIETAYYIEEKLYLQQEMVSSTSTNSSFSSDIVITDDNILDNDRSSSQICKDRQSSSGTPTNNGSVNSENRPTSSSSNQSIENTGSENQIPSRVKRNRTALNQRLLVTFCMLLLTYYRGENYRELKSAIRSFSQLISSQEFVESMINTRHFMTLKACLLFLMNMNRGNVIDEHQRLWLKRRLEDIDCAQAVLNESLDPNNHQGSDIIDTTSSPKNKKRYNNVNDDTTPTSVLRITKGDLTNLIRDRDFCSFQDGKIFK